jgi:hypothetical protein
VSAVKLTKDWVAWALLGPFGILPVALLVASTTDLLIEKNFTMILPPGRVSFLRGSDDYGCSNLFAGATALYVTFGVLASWFVTRCLSERHRSKTFAGDVARAVWILKFHIPAFLAGAYMFSAGGGCDASYGSDFRNVFLLACVVYLATLITTVWIYRLDWPQRRRFAVGPLAVAAWIVVGADGMTPKTWQVRTGDRFATEVHSRRHALMRTWYELCERTLGSTVRDGSR